LVSGPTTRGFFAGGDGGIMEYRENSCITFCFVFVVFCFPQQVKSGLTSPVILDRNISFGIV
jgi:hypothetical protein